MSLSLIYPVCPVHFKPYDRKSFFLRTPATSHELELLAGSFHVIWERPDWELNLDSIVGWGTAYCGGRSFERRRVIRHYKSYPVRNTALFKDTSDVYAHLPQGFIKVDFTEVTGDWKGGREYWHEEPRSSNPDNSCN